MEWENDDRLPPNGHVNGAGGGGGDDKICIVLPVNVAMGVVLASLQDPRLPRGAQATLVREVATALTKDGDVAEAVGGLLGWVIKFARGFDGKAFHRIVKRQAELVGAFIEGEVNSKG